MDMSVMEQVFFGNRLWDYAISVWIFLVGMLFVRIIFHAVVKRLKKLAEKSATTIDDFLADMLEKVALPVAYLTCLYLAVKVVTLPSGADVVVNAAQMVVVTFFAARMAIMTVTYGIGTFLAKKQNDPTLIRSLEGIMGVVRFLIWALAGVILLDNFGYKVSALLAGLGIGGVAVAIAAQTVLKDFFSYFSIVFDRPFKLGDFIIIGDFMGVVEHIGIKTSRIRSLGGEQLIFSNTDLTDSRVRNYKNMEQRRVVFRIGVTYQTKLAELKEIPKIIQGIVKSVKDTAFDRAHFFSYGDSSLVFEVVYYVLGPDYNKYMDIQQEINFAIKEEFEKRGIEFAYPTQTIFLSKTSS